MMGGLWGRDTLIILLRTAASLLLPIAFCLLVIDKTQTSGIYTNSDALYFPRLIEDVFQRPWGLKSWVFQPVPDFIPSIPIYLFAYLVTFNFRGAIIVSAIVQIGLFFGIGVLLYRRYRANGQSLVWIICFAAVLVVLINVDRVTPGVSSLVPVVAWLFEMFLLNSHFGSLIGSLLCVYFTDCALREDLKPAATAIFVCSILSGVSDYFFLLIFTAPMTVILLWLWLVSDIKRRCLVTLAAAGIGGATSFLLGYLVNHTVNVYLKPFDASRMSESWRALTGVFWNAGPEPLSLLILGVNVALAAYGATIMWGTYRRSRARAINDIPFLNIFVLNSVGASIAVSIAIVVFGIFDDVWRLRYFNCAVFMPAIIAAFLMAAWVENLVVGWNATRREALLNVAAALTIVGSAAIVAGTRIDLKAPNQSLLKCLEQEHAVAGMADFWNASPLVLFSHWKYHVVQIGADGSPYYWMTNRAWVDHDWSNPERPPRYSFIVMKYLPAGQIVDAYGRPDRIVTCEGTEIWFYTSTEELTSRLLRRR